MPILLPALFALSSNALAQRPIPPVVGPPIAYDVPVGASSGFSRLVLMVKEASSKDRAKASRLAKLLPRLDPAIYWDDRKVPAVSRAGFIAARDYALLEWRRMLNGFNPRFVTDPKLATGGLVFSFEPTLARGAGAAHFLSADSTLPRLETVIGLVRGGTPQPGPYTGEADVHNEVLYALGTYLGLDASPGFGGAMGRTDRRAADATNPGITEAGTANRALKLSDRLRAALAKGIPLVPRAPDAWAEKRSVDLGAVRQGEPAEVQFTVANNGSAPLLMLVSADCGCLTAFGPRELGPGETGVVRAKYDTSIIAGTTRHNVVLHTNDPETPRLAIPVTVFVRPPARILIPEGSTHLLESGRPLELFLVGDEGAPATLEGATVTGISGDLTTEPWSGSLADPVLGEEAKPRAGYRLLFTPKADALLAPGRRNATVEVRLKGVAEPLRTNFFLQRGIAAVPLSITFGRLDSTPDDVEFTVSRPSRPFAITGFGPLPPGLEATLPQNGASADRHTVRLRVFPGRLKRDLAATLIVRTDDPAQPAINVAVNATLPE